MEEWEAKEKLEDIKEWEGMKEWKGMKEWQGMKGGRGVGVGKQGKWEGRLWEGMRIENKKGS